MITKILDFSIPIWVIMILIIGITIGRVWQLLQTRAEMARLIVLVAELSHELSQHTTHEGSPLAKAVKAFNKDYQQKYGFDIEGRN